MRWPGFAMFWMACTSASQLDPPQEPPRPSVVVAAPETRFEEVRPASPGSASPPGVVPAAIAAPPRVVVAAHDAEIAMLAATDDGKLAVSADRGGGMRLWPSLDGTREPVVVQSDVAAQQLAVARDDDEIVIAAAGPLGQLALIRTSAAGAPISQVWVDLGRAIVALHATPGGFIGLRDDQTIAGVDLHGARLGTVAARPGERITAMVSRRGRVLAFVTAERRVRARWIEAGNPLAWGRESPALAIDPAHAVLAPGHERVAALTRDHRALVIVSLRDGRTLERPMDSKFTIDPAQALGFLDDHTLAFNNHREIQWWNAGSEKDIIFGLPAGPTVVTDRHFITTALANLALHSFDGTRLLGFRLLNVTSAARRGNGWVISDGQGIIRVDGELRARQRYRLPDEPPTQAEDLVVLDDRHCVMRLRNEVYLVDLAHPEDRALLASLPGEIQYEAATRLLLIGNAERWLGRYDPKISQFRETRALPSEDGPSRSVSIQLLDPAANQGNIAWKLVNDGDMVRIIAIRGVDFAAAAPFREGRSDTRKASSELLMALGRSEWWANGPMGPRFVSETIHRQLPATAHQHISPDGTLVAMVRSGRITLRDRRGNVRWAVAVPGVVDARWGGTGDLVALGSGMAKLDLATGALLDRRCGWEFGLWGDEARHELGARICEVP